MWSREESHIQAAVHSRESRPAGEGKHHIVHVQVRVKPESVEAFCQASIANARSSLLEPGVVRFDVVQRREDPTRFVLVEVYRSRDDPPRHRETAHYAAWRDAVEPMMAEPRTKAEYVNVFPEDSTWA